MRIFLLALVMLGICGARAAELLTVTPAMLSGPLVFFATPGAVNFAEPIPYGIANNLTDHGWIWPSDDTAELVVDFGVLTALTRFRVYSVYNTAERGANWAIEYSRDQSRWTTATEFAYRTSQGGGVDDRGDTVDGFGGWYEANFNETAVAERYWRIHQTGVLVTHAPRSGQVEFYQGTVVLSKPLVKSTSPTGITVAKNALIRVELEDGAPSQVAPATIQLFLNGQRVNPVLNKPAGTKVTTVTYDPPGDLPESTNRVRIIFGDTSTPPILQTNDFGFVVAGAGVGVNGDEIAVTPDMLSGPLNFFASPGGLTFADPIPYGIVNNTADQGWIWPSDSSGNLVIDFGAPMALARLRVYSTYPGGARGAIWAIEHSTDNIDWVNSTDFAFETTAGGGVNEDGSPRTDCAGWYEARFNPNGEAFRYWRILQKNVTIGHAPRAAQMQFYQTVSKEFPLTLSIKREGNTLAVSWADPFDTAVLESADAITGPWADVPHSFSPHVLTPSVARKFYRLRK